MRTTAGRRSRTGWPATLTKTPVSQRVPTMSRLLMYTSGTTGLPKGVMLTNGNYLCKAAGIAGEWRFTADSVSLAVMPLFHMAGSGWVLVGLYEGATTVVLRDVDPVAILDSGTADAGSPTPLRARGNPDDAG